MTDSPKYRMHLIRAHIDYITAETNDVDSMIENMISSDFDYENTVQLLCTISSVKHDSAITLSLKQVLICLSSILPNV